MKTRVDEHKARWVVWSLREIEYNMARRRHAQQGRIEPRNGAYWLRYYRDELRDGEIHRARPRQFLGYIDGKDKITKTEAKQKARDFLTEIDKPNARPTAMMTLRQYYESAYQSTLTAASVNHQLGFESGMTRWILPKLGDKQLRDITRDDAQALMNEVEKAGKSSSTVQHQRAYLSAILGHARDAGIITNGSITTKLKMPRKKRRNIIPALDFDRAHWVLTRLPQPYLTMAALSCCTSVGPAELCGMKLRRLNLSREIRMVEDKILPPLSAGILENWSNSFDEESGKLTKDFRDTKTQYRDRVIPIPAAIVPLLEEVLEASPFKGPDDPAFASRAGTPVNDNNANKRIFKPLAVAIGVDFTWNSFRHTFATLVEDLGIRQFDKKAFMGHSLVADITDGYTEQSWARMQAIADAFAGKLGIESLVEERRGKAKCQKVISIQKRLRSAIS